KDGGGVKRHSTRDEQGEQDNPCAEIIGKEGAEIIARKGKAARHEERGEANAGEPPEQARVGPVMTAPPQQEEERDDIEPGGKRGCERNPDMGERLDEEKAEADVEKHREHTDDHGACRIFAGEK